MLKTERVGGTARAIPTQPCPTIGHGRARWAPFAHHVSDLVDDAEGLLWMLSQEEELPRERRFSDARTFWR